MLPLYLRVCRSHPTTSSSTYRPFAKTILAKYYTGVFIQGSGAPQKPRVVPVNTILGINTILDFDFSCFHCGILFQACKYYLWRPVQKQRVCWINTILGLNTKLENTDKY